MYKVISCVDRQAHLGLPMVHQCASSVTLSGTLCACAICPFSIALSFLRFLCVGVFVVWPASCVHDWNQFRYVICKCSRDMCSRGNFCFVFDQPVGNFSPNDLEGQAWGFLELKHTFSRGAVKTARATTVLLRN